MICKGGRFQVSGSRFQVQGFRFEVQGSRFKVRGSRFEVPATRNLKLAFATIQQGQCKVIMCQVRVD